jgi:hypothetical protein
VSQPHWNSNQFNVRIASDDAQTNAVMKAAPNTGSALYVTDIHINMGATARLVSVLDGASGTAIWKGSPAAAGMQTIHFKTPLKLTAATALCCTTAGASVGFFIAVNGYSARA